MYRAMYETKYRTSADNTTDSDLQEFIWQYAHSMSLLASSSQLDSIQAT